MVAGDRKFVGMLHDLSVRKRIEQQLSEQQSLAKIGEMAAVLAHEIAIRWPASAVRCRSWPQLRAGNQGGDGHEGDHRPGRYARRAMQDLLLYARPPKPRPAPVDLKRLILTTVELLSRDPDVSGVQVKVEGSARWCTLTPSC